MDMDERWRIDELARVVEMALDTGDYPGQESGRVRSVPDARTIRYYTTLGLLDKPAEMRGRTAYYGRRHVLELVAIKRMQSQGRPLVEVQQALAGADDRSLNRHAALPAGFWQRVAEVAAAGADAETTALRPAPSAAAASKSLAPKSPEAIAGRQRREEFWQQAPQTEAPAGNGAPPSAEDVAPVTAMHLHVAPGVRLEVEGVDPGKLNEAAFVDVAAAMQSLAAALARAGWIPGIQLQSPASEQPESGRSAGESEVNP